MNSISRMPPGPSFTCSARSRRATSFSMSAFISRSDFEHAEIEIAPVDERPHALGMDQLVGRGAGDGARLDPGITLPVAAMRLQVVVEECGADGQRPAVAEGPQAHVDAEHDALGGALAQQADHQPAEPREEILVVDAARARGLALVGKHEDQIDVGGEIELAAAELAHAEHDERLRFAGGAARLAVGAHEIRGRVVHGRLDGGVGEGAGVGQRFAASPRAGEVAPGDAHHLALALAAQRRHESGEVAAPGDRRREALRHLAVRQRRVERRLVDQPLGERRRSRLRPSQTKSLAASTRGNASRSVGRRRFECRRAHPTRAGVSVVAHRRWRGRRSRARDCTRNSYLQMPCNGLRFAP